MQQAYIPHQTKSRDIQRLSTKIGNHLNGTHSLYVFNAALGILAGTVTWMKKIKKWWIIKEEIKGTLYAGAMNLGLQTLRTPPRIYYNWDKL